MTGLDGLETFFGELCEAAAKETLPRFRTQLDVANKQDGGFDPVTVADREAERVIRERINERYPAHGILGEEFGDERLDAEYVWVIDPVDGTRAFISGLPSWGTLIGLTKNGKPIAGVMHQPFTGEMFLATGEGTRLWQQHQKQPAPLRTRQTAQIEEALLMTTSPALFPEDERLRFDRLEASCRLPRYGFDCYAYAMVAGGHVDLVVESGLKPFDIVALIPLIEQAGGVVTTWDGGDAATGGQILAAANEQIHAQAMELLSG